MTIPQLEEEVLKFWQKKKIFEKSVRQRRRRPLFSFYDGPPFATGLPHYGHILATAIKDTVVRFWVMRGYQVKRRVGWDCHGLPVENLIEKELKVRTKKDIEEKIGLEKFNQACRNSVFRCVGDFQKTLQRVGRWADYTQSYSTMDSDYTESVWWVFKKLDEAGLVYQDFRVTPYCSRCGTPLSNFEVNLGYQEVEDESIFVKFLLEDGRYLLVWTTTPWTLPGNAAVAVNPNFIYSEVRIGREILILAEGRIKEILEGKEYQILKKFLGKELIGLNYSPLYKIDKVPECKKIYQVVGADFVSLEEGTGLVHLAPAFGEDDQNVGRKEGLPMLITVDLEGKIVSGLSFPGEGKFIKEADQDIKDDLRKRKLLFRSEKIKHTYPFCWRCNSPLIYYPIKSWYIKVSQLRKQLVKNNQKIRWVPAHLKEGRFGKWIEGAKDWCVSRNRYWGAPIPVWKCQDCRRHLVIGSKKELGRYNIGSNYYYFLRHGESTCYRARIIENDITNDNCHLTSLGKGQIKKVARKLVKGKIDLIIASDFLRTRETAEIVAKELNQPIIFDSFLRDLDVGELNGRQIESIDKQLLWTKDSLSEPFPKGESRLDCWQRMKNVFDKLEKKYQGKKILIVGHAFPLECFWGIVQGWGLDEVIARKTYFKIAELRKSQAKIWPFNRQGRFDFHRPYIDSIKLKCPFCGGVMKRDQGVFDCWFESGSMPYAQWHYPFANKRLVEKSFPADFIAEGMDQTRGWFYTLHVLASALTLKDIGLGKNQPAFKNVIVNGLVLGEDGRKLSKHLKNYSPPEEVIDKYGADSLRFFLLASTPIGQDYLFSERRVGEVFRRVIMTLWNLYSFFEVYRPRKVKLRKKISPKNILDRWIISRLNSLNQEIIKQMEKYELTKAVRPIIDFIDDLSNWYVRRSRKRFQKSTAQERKIASEMLGLILLRLSLITAPAMPFISESLYRRLSKLFVGNWLESVHLNNFPQPNKMLIDYQLEDKMRLVRDISRQILAERSKLGIKVRQPLAKVILKKDLLKNQDLWLLIKEETNIKQVEFNINIKEEIILDTLLTPELKEEGFLREFIHQIQMLRKKSGMKPSQKVVLAINGDQELINWVRKNQLLVKKEASIRKIVFDLIGSGLSKEIVFDGKKIVIGI